MGYEKIEPGVQRKDVDRRFTALRKQQIRNTALRFRFNVITQKFNTYSMYWTRICRQIEEGTYKRHVAKAAKRFGGPNARAREQDWSIDVELGDFEDVDMDAVLAEADAAAEAYGRSAEPADTVPPPAPPAIAEPPPSVRTPAAPRAPMTMATPGTSFAIAGAHRSVPEGPGSERTPAPGPALRAARHAPLPPGAKQPVVVRRRGDGDAPPPSTPAIRAPMASPDRSGPPSSSVIRPAPGSSPNPNRPPPAPSPAASSGGLPPSAGRLPAAGPSSVRVPVAAAPSSVARAPVAPASSAAGVPGPAASSGRLPGHAVPPGPAGPAGPAGPMAGAAPRATAGAPSTPRTPASPPQPPSAGVIRTPASAPQVTPRPQGYRPAALPPSANRVPVAQAAPASPRTPPSPMPIVRPSEGQNAKAPVAAASKPRAPAPSSSGEPVPGSDPSGPAGRVPPPLPGQVKKNP